MSLRDFARSVEPDDMSYDECDGPIDDGLDEWPASDLEYIVYYDPDRQPELDFEAIEKEVLAEIAPRYRVVYFERLRAETLRSWSPFATRTVEEDFLARGYGRGPVTGLNAPQGPAALRRRHDYLTHHQARAESLVAMRCLGYVNRSILTSVQALVPVRERPNWLRRSLGEILTPVCGRASRAAGDELDVPDLPLTSRDGLLLACDRLDARRTVHPAVSTTPDTVERMGRRDLRRWCALNHDAVNLRIRQELADPNRYFGGAFDPCAAALWQSQTVMELRIALAEMERRLLANNPAAGDVDAEQNTNFRVKLDNDFGKDNPAYREPQIVPAGRPLRRRLLTAFYGGMSLPYDQFFFHEYAALEGLARWIGRLRREGRAVMDHSVAWNLRDIVDKSLLDLDRMLDASDAEGAEAVLIDLLPVAGWEALIEAAHLVMTGEHEHFSVTYNLLGPDDPGPSGRIDATAGAVEILGPFLMLPLQAAEFWLMQTRRVQARGLYLD